jgi:hypothetical protein
MESIRFDRDFHTKVGRGKDISTIGYLELSIHGYRSPRAYPLRYIWSV